MGRPGGLAREPAAAPARGPRAAARGARRPGARAAARRPAGSRPPTAPPAAARISSSPSSRHFVGYATVCFFLLMVAGFRAAFIVALAWGIGLVMHYFFALVAPDLRRRLIDSEVSREVETTRPVERRSLEDKHARSLEQLSASIAHEIRNPITAAKSLVQQMGEDPSSRENVAYANVALEELDRVERSISHLLKYAREEELHVGELRVAEVVDSALETLPRSDRTPGRHGDERARRRGRDGGRRREAAPGADQPDGQCARRAGGGAHAGPAHPGDLGRGPGRPRGVAARARQRAGDRPREARPDLQPLLHLEVVRHRSGPRDLEEARRCPWRLDRSPFDAGPGHRVPAHLPEARGPDRAGAR